MINAFLVFNGQGQPRLTKFYTQLVSFSAPPARPKTQRCMEMKLKLTADDLQDTSIQQRLISEIFTLVSNRPASSCNFLPLPPLLAASGTSSSGASSEPQNDVPSLVTYRNYATLYFIVISTSTESPLALIDLIQVYVEALDKLFENVCELDLIFNFETLHAALSEMVVGGVVIETSLDRIVAGVRAQGTVAKRPVNEGRGSGGGGGGGIGSGLSIGMGGNFGWAGR
ncbi:AP-3 complex subunit sigma [Cordyceps fumosorosea ARSEF 2679]|uniref:AP-3 complex subunit sigma n=1 Tax=Cordyceps fumosorosea (strain ARSEF 2679) TaxID=1081104 RepID=A0A167VWD4_CORFA|nr:AP-3 complex subunit sigma [Cordyceps fumosorosea ARSEF 2679]OAA63051.1 AP-3 complex subunit sigma [Cordyceps fumosorosea ARSEF 2679]